MLVILEELGLPYETSWVEIEDLKKEPYESVNPNGRVPGKRASVLPNRDTPYFSFPHILPPRTHCPESAANLLW